MRIRFPLPVIAVLLCLIPSLAFTKERTLDFNPSRNAYFGDLHVHTGFSWDARLFGTKTLPEDAYRYAKGEAIDFAGGGKIQLKHGTMDFLAVTDHAEYLGVLNSRRKNNPAAPDGDCDRMKIVRGFIKHGQMNKQYKKMGKINPAWHDPIVERSAWQEVVAAAERHYVPGKFTTFAGYEWTSAPGGMTLHRNVIFRGSNVPYRPFSALDSQHPEDLWNWLDGIRGRGIEAFAIPHNPNLSGGLAFTMIKSSGSGADAEWAAQRLRNEPIVEMTQVKGTSETSPLLSPTDEWADFEIVERFPRQPKKEKAANAPAEKAAKPPISKNALRPAMYVRQAYKTGLELSEKKGFNPYKFGMIGSTDTHNSASCQEEDNYFGKAGCLAATPAFRIIKPDEKIKGLSKDRE
ncbi:MAG: DUF3604 domain-containing protein, partial [Deltaproteobacteria bacterium]|nr:DUF3604 domain-containing protein [Deltaproteobacteria bacterium]